MANGSADKANGLRHGAVVSCEGRGFGGNGVANAVFLGVKESLLISFAYKIMSSLDQK